MATIEMLPLSPATRPAELWRSVAHAARDWLAERRLPVADAVLLLPFAELLAPARRALAQSGGWLPRVHTTRTLAAALGPPAHHAAGELSGDATIDRATARDLLRGHAWAAAWLQRDPRAFDAALQSLVRTAHALRSAAISRPPHERATWWQLARQQVDPGGGVGATHRLLLRVAIEWCALSDGTDTDRLFEHRPAAWIVLTLGGEDALALNVMREAAAQGVPVLQLSGDPVSSDPFEQWPERCAFELEVADDAEAEALATAWQVAQQVSDGVTPVALVAQDRALVRRVRALLERLHIDVVDETGWSLATTRAGAHAAAALRATRAPARSDDVLDWLKADLGEHVADELATLEKLWRGARVQDAGLRTRADALWLSERARLDSFARPRQRPLARWLRAFDALLYGAAHSAAWRDDAAAVQLRRALHLNEQGHGDGAWPDAMATTWSLEEFTHWVDATLEEAAFVPPAGEQAARVVVTPLSRVIGREFAVAVMPGADEQRLGPLPLDPGLLDENLRRNLGLPERSARERRAALSFVQLLRLPRVIALRRRADADELLSASPWIERLRLARRQRGAPAPIERDVQLPQREVAVSPTPRPLPQAVGALPVSLSASAVEALRQCPYRFFSRVALRLSEQEELDDDADKREAGKWLHATLERFHVARTERRAAADDIDQFVATGREALAALTRAEGVSQEAMLPFSAGLHALATRYTRWLHAQEAQGWRFQAAEESVDATAEPGLALRGRIDRIDTRIDPPAVRLIDYKTSSREVLKDKVRTPLEDTQLAVYAMLQLTRQPAAGPVEACYLALDDAEEAFAVVHPDVEHSARMLAHHVAAERARIEAGAPLPALGEEPVCDTCEARGLCRRDHWSDHNGDASGAA
ncbi:MAG TPA: PD-(D/E)XK nuclease family protein [Burkholderiaceae bacterium]|nr:PD-(D/E)XK nuclease family protein [Burkholderiaceae bacterium]